MSDRGQLKKTAHLSEVPAAWEAGPRGAKPRRLVSTRTIVVYGTLFVAAAYYLLPLYVMIVTSFKPMIEIRQGGILALPHAFTLEPWRLAWSQVCTGAACEGIRGGFWNSVRITVPSTLNLDLEGMYTDITVEGANGTVEAETLQGDIIIRGGRGTVRADATTGEVLVEGAEGEIEVETAAGDIRFVNVGGSVVAESTGGDIFFENARATSVDAGSTGGRIQYQGTFQQSGRYFFGSHGGSVLLIVPEGTSAAFNLASVHGSVTTNVNGTLQRLERGQRNSITVGTGGAIVEVETFGGRIAVMREGTEGALQQ